MYWKRGQDAYNSWSLESAISDNKLVDFQILRWINQQKSIIQTWLAYIIIDNIEKLTHSSDILSQNVLYCTILGTSHCEKYWDKTISSRNVLYVDVGRFESSKRMCLLNVLDIDKIIVLEWHC